MDALNLTTWLLLARYNGMPVIPAKTVCEDFFEPLTYPKFLERTGNGRIGLPIIKMYESQKAPRYIHVRDLSEFLEEHMSNARARIEGRD